jgi:acyl carrier protein
MERVKELVANILAADSESLPPVATPLRDIEGWDSLKHVQLVVGLESGFRVKLSADDIKQMVTMADIGRILQEKGVGG